MFEDSQAAPHEQRGHVILKTRDVKTLQPASVNGFRYNAMCARKDRNFLAHIPPEPTDAPARPWQHLLAVAPQTFKGYGLAVWPAHRVHHAAGWSERHSRPFVLALCDDLADPDDEYELFAQLRGKPLEVMMRPEDFEEFVAEHPMTDEEWADFERDMRETEGDLLPFLERHDYVVVGEMSDDEAAPFLAEQRN